MSFDPIFFQDELLPALNRGLMVSLALIIPASIIGFILGVVLGCTRTYGSAFLKKWETPSQRLCVASPWLFN